MEILELMRQRHSIRHYLDKPIEDEKKDVINDYINRLNKRYNTHVQIFYDDPSLFKNGQVSYGNFSNCQNIIALVGKDKETLGYVGELLVLKLQEIGLNTCFVGLTYERKIVKKMVN